MNTVCFNTPALEMNQILRLSDVSHCACNLFPDERVHWNSWIEAVNLTIEPGRDMTGGRGTCMHGREQPR